MKIQIFGMGCPNCKKLYELTKTVVAQNNWDSECEIEHITDVAKMVAIGIMQAPAIVIDGKSVLSGRIPSATELKKIILQYRK